jgi:hypothetical protein
MFICTYYLHFVLIVAVFIGSGLFEDEGAEGSSKVEEGSSEEVEEGRDEEFFKVVEEGSSEVEVGSSTEVEGSSEVEEGSVSNFTSNNFSCSSSYKYSNF